MSGLSLSTVVSKLNKIAPLALAESWDNVGLLVEPSGDKSVKRVLLTNDLTQDVLTEALDSKTDMIISYHPPIFSGMKRLTMKSWKEKLVIKCLENRIAVYSPHTCWDAIKGGVNDWLVSAFQSKLEESRPIQVSQSKDTPNGYSHMITIPLEVDRGLDDATGKNALRELLKVSKESGNAYVEQGISTPDGVEEVTILCAESLISRVVDVLQTYDMGSALKAFRIVKLEKSPLHGVGMGRFLTLRDPMKIGDMLPLLKKHFGVETLRVGLGVGHKLESTVKTIALCAGSGSSVIGNSGADILLTGEMSHHLVMDAQHRGATVILAEHSHTERGFLRFFAPKLAEILEEKVEVAVSTCDKDPLTYL